MRTQPLLVIAALFLFATSAHAQQCFSAPAGLIGWWPGDGNPSDIQGGNDGTPQNGASFSPGLVGEAFDLDGVDDHILVAHAANLNFGPTDPMTFDAWVFRTASSSIMSIVGKRSACGSSGIHYQMAFDPPRGLHFGGETTLGDIAVTGIQLPLNSWTHLAGTFDGITFNFYIDGVLSGSGTGTLGPTNSNPLKFGASDNCPATWQGLIDEVDIFDRALSATEVEAIFLAGSAGKCKDEDADGFRPPEDCDETNAAINPDAAELPGNFVDEDCNGDLGSCDPCFDWRNHGEYVRCVAHAAEDLVASGDISQEHADELVSSAARSDNGKRAFVPPECH